VGKELGLFLQAARISRGWDQAHLARLLGGAVRQQAVSGWESGRSRPQKDLIPALAELLEVNVGELLMKGGYVAVRPSSGTRPLQTTLPFEALTDDEFEAFTCEFLHCLHQDAHVYRYGKTGHKQGGLDVFVDQDGRHVLGVQVKKEKSFGPAKVNAVVKEVTIEADAYSIFSFENRQPPSA